MTLTAVLLYNSMFINKTYILEHLQLKDCIQCHREMGQWDSVFLRKPDYLRSDPQNLWKAECSSLSSLQFSMCLWGDGVWR